MRRKACGSRRRNRRSRTGPLLLGLAALAGLGIALAAARRRPLPPWDDEEIFTPHSRDLAEPEATEESSSDLSVWIAGPAGNLYVRDGGVDSERPPVLFVHSLGGNSSQWVLQLDHLRRERRAAALDLRGHGESDPAEDGDYSVAAFAADIAAVADQLDLRHFVLAGHSLGASAAIEYASRHPERVKGLLLVDPNGDQTRIPAEQIEAFLDTVRADPMNEMDWYFKQLLVGGDRAASRWVLDDLHATDSQALLRAVEASSRYSPLPALLRYAGPRLALVSDMNSLPYSLHNLVRDLPVKLIAGTGHWLMVDRPELVNGLVDEFLEGI